MSVIRSRNIQIRGFSLIELMATLVIAAIVVTASLRLLTNMQTQSESVNLRMERVTALQNCLDKMMDDVISTSQNKAKVEVEHGIQGWLETSRITITKKGDENSGNQQQIDWVASSSDEGDDLILYRREIVGKEKGTSKAKYIPLCRNLYSFRVDLLNAEGLEDPNSPPAVLQVQADLYRTRKYDKSSLIDTSRTFCLRRDY